MLSFILFLNRHGNNGFRYIFIPVCHYPWSLFIPLSQCPYLVRFLFFQQLVLNVKIPTPIKLVDNELRMKHPFSFGICWFTCMLIYTISRITHHRIHKRKSCYWVLNSFFFSFLFYFILFVIFWVSSPLRNSREVSITLLFSPVLWKIVCPKVKTLTRHLYQFTQGLLQGICRHTSLLKSAWVLL